MVEVEEDATNVAKVGILHESVKLKKADVITVEKVVTSKLIALKKNNSQVKALATNVVDQAIMLEIVKMKKITQVLLMFLAIDVVIKVTWLEIVKVALKHVTTAKNLVTKLKIVAKNHK